MAGAAPPYVDNPVTAGREALPTAEANAIRARCAREVELGIPQLIEAIPPRAPRRTARPSGRDPTLYQGLLGLAFGLLHIHERTGLEEHAQRAVRYLAAAEQSLEHSGFPLPEEWLSFHGTGGLAAIAAVVHDRVGNGPESKRSLERYARVADAAAEPSFPTEDLLWGRGGFLFGAAFVRKHLGPSQMPDAVVLPALAALLENGRATAQTHGGDLREGPHGRSPLVYLNLNAPLYEFHVRSYVGGRSRPARALARWVARGLIRFTDRRFDFAHRYDTGLVHGLAGALYLALHFPGLLAQREGWLDDVRTSLDCLSDCLDPEHGLLELLPSPRSDAFHTRTRTDRFSRRVHWCNGTTGAVFLFARAYELFGNDAYLQAARRAADHVWRYGLLRKGNGICHGVAGNGYAFLTLFRATSEQRYLERALHFARSTWTEEVTREQRTPDRPWSLYEGRMGTLCFLLDCLDPERARFPAFEV